MRAWRAAAAMVLSAAAGHRATTVADSMAPQPPAAIAIPWRAAVRAASVEPRRPGPTICRAVAALSLDSKATAHAVATAVVATTVVLADTAGAAAASMGAAVDPAAAAAASTVVAVDSAVEEVVVVVDSTAVV